MVFISRWAVWVLICFAVFGARAEQISLNDALQAANHESVRIVVHPEVPFAETEAWIEEKIDPDKRIQTRVDTLRLIHDQRPIRLRLLFGQKNRLCVIFHNEVRDGMILGLPKGLGSADGMRFLIAHEIFHCNDGSTLGEIDSDSAISGIGSSELMMEKTRHKMEVRADVSAAISHLVNGGSADFLRLMRNARLKNWSTGDFVHDSTDSLARVIRDAQSLTRANLKDMSLLVEYYTRDQLSRDWLAYKSGSQRYAERFRMENGLAFNGILENVSGDEKSIHPWDDIAMAWKMVDGIEVVNPFPQRGKSTKRKEGFPFRL